MGNNKSKTSLTFSTFETPVSATFITTRYPGHGKLVNEVLVKDQGIETKESFLLLSSPGHLI